MLRLWMEWMPFWIVCRFYKKNINPCRLTETWVGCKATKEFFICWKNPI